MRESGAYRGFALELSRRLVAGLELSILERAQTATRARIKVRFRLPAAADVSHLVWNWDPEKLAALGAREQEKIVQALEKLEKAGKLARIESQETFNLRKEGRHWRIFLDWASGVNVTFGFLAARGDIQVRFSEQWIVAQVGVPFQIAFTVANRSAAVRTIQIAHRIAPQPIAEHLEMIQCGLLSPVTLTPGSKVEFSSAYILTGDIPAAVKDVKIVYAYETNH